MISELKLYIFIFLTCFFFKIKHCQVSECKLTNDLTGAVVANGFPKIKYRAKSVGILNISLIFTDFRDAVATITPQEMLSKVSPTTENFFERNSYGKLRVNFKANLKWLRMSKLSNGYVQGGWGSITTELQRAYMQEAADLAKSNGIDLSNTDILVVMMNPAASRGLPYSPTFVGVPGSGIKVNGKEILNGVTTGADFYPWMESGGKSYLLNHELGHSLGLADLYAHVTTQGSYPFTGEWSVMGNINSKGRSYLGWERWLLGWLDDSQVACIKQATSKKTTSISLSAIETINSVNPRKMIVIPVKGSKKQAVVVEARANLGDDTLTKEGLLVYFVDTSVSTGNGVIKVLPINSDNNKLNNVLAVGESIVYGDITVKLISKKGGFFQADVIA